MGGNKLIPGSVRSIYDGTLTTPLYLQIIHLKGFEMEAKTPGAPSSVRYKIVLSDSYLFIQGTLSGTLNHLFESKMISVYSVIKLTSFSVSEIKGHRIVFVGGIDVNDVEAYENKVGIPANVETVINTSSNNNEVSQVPNFNSINQIANNSANNAPTIAAGGLVSSTSNNTKSSNTNIINNSNNNNMSSGTPTKRSFNKVDNSESNAELEHLIQPISTLSPYNDRWVIKARVIGKTEVKKWANQRGEGKLFSCTLCDESGEIRMTAFKDACDKFFDVIENGKTYLVSNALVKIAKKQFGGVKNDYEIHLEANSLAQETSSSNSLLIHYDFVPIAKIATYEKDSFIDVLAVIKDCGSVQSITAKTSQRQLVKRDLTLVDSSCSAIKLTLWSEQAENFNSQPGTTVAIKSAKVSDFNGSKSLTTMSTSLIELEPVLPQTKQLLAWYYAEGTNLNMSTANDQMTMKKDDVKKTLDCIKTENLGMSEKADYFSVSAFISYIKPDAPMSYTACPSEGCNKKVSEYGPNLWRCERCARQYDSCQYRYLFSTQIADGTDSTWVNIFNEAGESLFNCKADTLALEKQDNETEYVAKVKSLLYKEFVFKLRAKQETYQGETRLKVGVVDISDVDYAKEAKLLADQLIN